MGGQSRRPTLHGGLVLVLAFTFTPGVPAQTAAPSNATALTTSQAAIGRQLDDYGFFDQRGQALRLSSLRGKPVVLSLVYTSCFQVCSGLTVHLRDVTNVARKALGADSFTVLTVGFDTQNDTPERMQLYARDRGADQPGWIFASTDAATIERLTRDVGFTYQRSPKGFDHITQTTVVDRAGRVMLQVYGESFDAPSLVEPLKRLLRGQELERGTLAGLVRSVELFCTIYDPASGRYRFDYSIVADALAGILALGMVGIVIAVSWRNSR
jgi:protein SCO1/2